jgi:hypothetical protein
MFCTCFPRKSLKPEDAELIDIAKKEAETSPREESDAPKELQAQSLVPPVAIEVSLNTRYLFFSV